MLRGPRPARPTASSKPSTACFKRRRERLAVTRASRRCARFSFSLLASTISRASIRMSFIATGLPAASSQSSQLGTLGVIGDSRGNQPSTRRTLVHPHWTRARGLLLLSVLQTLSHSGLRGPALLRRGTGRCFCVTSAPNPLFSGLARCRFTSVLLR